MYRDVKLAIKPEEQLKNSVFRVVIPSGKEFDIKFDEEGNLIPFKGITDEDFYLFLKSELVSRRIEKVIEPAHIKVMKEFELVDFDPNTSNFGYLKNVI